MKRQNDRVQGPGSRVRGLDNIRSLQGVNSLKCKSGGWNYRHWFLKAAAGLVVLLGFSFQAPQSIQAQESPLDEYIAAGLENNLALQQHSIDLERSFRALDEARGMFMPEVSLQARYSRASGGRQISFPVGDLLNPVYGTLNDMLIERGQPAQFPQLDNVEIAFLRDREQETKVRIIQPLFQPAILHNYRLQQHLASSQEAAVEAYKQVLIRDIKTAYYNYLKANRGVDIYNAARDLVDENLRVNESLVQHAKVTQDAVYRARSEMLAVAQLQNEAKKDRDLAQSYFNFLLNQSFETPIEKIDDRVLLASTEPAARLLPASQETTTQPYEALEELALGKRHELKQLESAIAATQSAVAVSKSAFLPGVSFAFDLGMQGTSYGLTGDRSFYMASIVLDWKLFSGFQNRSRLQRAQLETQKLRTQHDELQRQIQLQVQEAYDNVEVAFESLATAEERLRSSREGYRLVSRKYEEGMTNQVSFLDARSTLTEAEMNLNITRYDLLIRMAELEYATAVNRAMP